MAFVSQAGLYSLKAYLAKLEGKQVPEIIEAAWQKVQQLEASGQEPELKAHLKELIMLLKLLRLSPPLRQEAELRQVLISFLTRVAEYDRRARHALNELNKIHNRPL